LTRAISSSCEATTPESTRASRAVVVRGTRYRTIRWGSTARSSGSVRREKLPKICRKVFLILRYLSGEV
jgi:hypothetical protein